MRSKGNGAFYLATSSSFVALQWGLHLDHADECSRGILHPASPAHLRTPQKHEYLNCDGELVATMVDTHSGVDGRHGHAEESHVAAKAMQPSANVSEARVGFTCIFTAKEKGATHK